MNISASAIATIFFAKLLLGTHIDSTFVATAMMTVAVLVFGEITPKYIAKAYPERLSILFYPAIKAVYLILIPLNFVFIGWKNLISKIFSLDREEVITEDEIMTFVEEAEDDGTLKEDETRLIKSVIDFDDLEAKDVLTARVNIRAVSEDAEFDEVRRAFGESGFTRLPIFRDSLDEITGIVHLKDFYGRTEKCAGVREIAQKPFFVTEHAKLPKLLKTFQKERIHLAVVLDEYGGTLGIITLEDILEELVGDIWDEHDEAQADFKTCADGSLVFSGDIPLEKMLGAIGADAEKITCESNTLSGWIVELAGEVLEKGKSLERDGFCFEILETNGKVHSKVKVRRAE